MDCYCQWIRIWGPGLIHLTPYPKLACCEISGHVGVWIRQEKGGETIVLYASSTCQRDDRASTPVMVEGAGHHVVFPHRMSVSETVLHRIGHDGTKYSPSRDLLRANVHNHLKNNSNSPQLKNKLYN